ncbi:MAG TPA: hypothetical protein VHO06_13280 [Polyangia bacterium]|nr:hypothetical protein [Polyangia bacterium]
MAFVVGALAPAVRAQTSPAREALGTYEDQALGVRHLVEPLRDGSTAAAGDRVHLRVDWDAFQGKDHHPIDAEVFLRTVGRYDLARRYHRKVFVKEALSRGGGLLIAGGLAAALLAVTPGGQPAGMAGEGGQSPRFFNFSPAWGLAAAGAGLVASIAGRLIDPSPIDADEADRLARDYDRSLRARYGLVESASRE